MTDPVAGRKPVLALLMQLPVLWAITLMLPVLQAQAATGATLSITDSVTNAPRRFYRLVLSP